MTVSSAQNVGQQSTQVTIHPDLEESKQPQDSPSNSSSNLKSAKTSNRIVR